MLSAATSNPLLAPQTQGSGRPSRLVLPHVSAATIFGSRADPSSAFRGRCHSGALSQRAIHKLSYVNEPFLLNLRCGRQAADFGPRPARRREDQNGGCVRLLFHGSQISGEDHGAEHEIRGGLPVV